jgi:hypothetical protein
VVFFLAGAFFDRRVVDLRFALAAIMASIVLNCVKVL